MLTLANYTSVTAANKLMLNFQALTISILVQFVIYVERAQLSKRKLTVNVSLSVFDANLDGMYVNVIW